MTNTIITLHPFGDVPVDIEISIDIHTEAVTIDDVTIQGQHFAWQMIRFTDGRTFAETVMPTLQEKAEDYVGSFAAARSEAAGEAKRDARSER